MLCERCKKSEAVATVDVMINGERHAQHLCMECVSRQSGLFKQFLKMAFAPNDQYIERTATKQPAPEQGVRLVCPGCGTTDEDFRRTGMFGCPECYETFASLIDPQPHEIFENIRECMPVITDREKEIAVLRHDLGEAVKEEQYAKAAQLRDRIKELEDEADS